VLSLIEKEWISKTGRKSGIRFVAAAVSGNYCLFSALIGKEKGKKVD